MDMDPYAKVTVNGVLFQQTHVHSNGHKAPSWDCVLPALTTSNADVDSVVVEIFDRDKLLSDDLVARASVPVSAILNDPACAQGRDATIIGGSDANTIVLPLEPQGEITFRAAFRIVDPPLTKMGGCQHQCERDYGMRRGKVEVKVCGGVGFKTQENYVKVTLATLQNGSCSQRTDRYRGGKKKGKEEGKNFGPKWNEVLPPMSTANVDADVMTVELFDWDR
jgi:Ca2+-dependent lipid-binding protein